MNDQATTPRRTLPDGRPAPDTAPDSALLDHDDLATMYKALREGNAVGLSSDGHVFIDRNNPAPPIDIADQHYVEGKLAEMKGMLQMGFMVKVRPDGSITANSNDNSFQYRADPHHELGSDDRAFIHDSLVGGANVAIRPDGTIEVNYPQGAQRRQYVDDVDRIMNELDNQIRSGKLGEAARAGSGLVIAAGENGATQFEYRVQPPSTAPPIAFPADTRDPMDPTGPAAMQDEAKQLTDRAAAIRETSPAMADAMDKRAQALNDAADHLNEANRLRTEAGNSAHRGYADEAQRIEEQSASERQLGTDALTTARGIEVGSTVPDPTQPTATDSQPAGGPPSPAGDGAGTPDGESAPPGTGTDDDTGTGSTTAPRAPVTLPPPIELAGTAGAPDTAFAAAASTEALGDPVLGGTTLGDPPLEGGNQLGEVLTGAGGDATGSTGTLGTDQTANPPAVDTPVGPHVLGGAADTPDLVGDLAPAPAGTTDAPAGSDTTMPDAAQDTFPDPATGITGTGDASTTDIAETLMADATVPDATLPDAGADDAGMSDTGTAGTGDGGSDAG
jgi:hypothetical protein